MQTKLMLVLTGIAAGALGGCDHPPTMSVASPTASVGEDIVVAFSSPVEGKASNLYWITLQPVDADDARSTGRVIVEHGQTTARVRASESGSLEVRLHDRYPQKESNLVARAPVRVRPTRDQTGGPAVGPIPSSEKECLDDWLAKEKLDAYGSQEGSVYGKTSPLFDPSSERMTARTAYLYAKHPSAKVACAPSKEK